MGGQSQDHSRGSGKKGQHFLLSPAARTLSIVRVAKLTDDEAYALFKRLRWVDTQGDPVCPHCQCDAIYHYKTRRIFRCKSCEKQFSVTSGTIFHNRKLPITTIVLAIAFFANAVKGHAATHLSRQLDISYKTAFVLAHKIREAIGAEAKEIILSGVVEVDGAYSGGKIKQKNRVEDRIDRRLARNQNGKQRVVIVGRQRGEGGRTITFVVNSEAEAVAILADRIKMGTLIHADEARSWDPLFYYGYDLKRVNHQECFSDDITGACTNQAESFFSRYRRSEFGIHHHFAGPYLGAYAAELAWREDSRRISNGAQFLLIGMAALTQPPSPIWKGYWQRRKPVGKTQPP